MSFAVSAGRDVWLSTTRAFADQLESQGQHQRAVLYYLACHDTYKAIDVFKRQAMYRYVLRDTWCQQGVTHVAGVLFYKELLRYLCSLSHKLYLQNNMLDRWGW